MSERRTVTIHAVQRAAKVNKEGNPQYTVTTDQGTWRTAPGGAVGYGISNSEYAGEAILTIDDGVIVGVATSDGKHLSGRQS